MARDRTDEATEMTSGYREWAPTPTLAGAVARVWMRVVPRGAPPALVLPDACVDLIWQQGRGVFVAGPDTGPMPTPLPPGTVLVGVRFLPGAGGPALGVPLDTLRNQRVDLSDVRPDVLRHLPADVTPMEACRRLTATALELVTAGPPDPWVRRAGELLARRGSGLGTVVRMLDVSERQLRRRCQSAVGYGPKTLQRVLRFRRFLAHLDASGRAADLARVAADVGYADQAHLTRETRRLAGLPPAALARARLLEFG